MQRKVWNNICSQHKNKIPIKYIVICVISTLICAYLLGLGVDIGSFAVGILGFAGLFVFIALGIASSIICYTIWRDQD